jgi:hypothetical protein
MEKLLSINVTFDTNFSVRAGFRLKSSNDQNQSQKKILIFFSKHDKSFINKLTDDNKCDNQSNLRSKIFKLKI